LEKDEVGLAVSDEGMESPHVSALLLALRLRIERREATASPSSLGRGTLLYLL
jgi:hypothetical protein